MKEIIKVIRVVFFCSFSLPILAQQEPHFTQYPDNTLFVNPAYAGSRGLFNLIGRIGYYDGK